MGVLARYLDLLPNDARERILSASHWTTRGSIDEHARRDLLGHAEDWYWPDHQRIPACRAPAVFHLRAAAGDELWTDEPQIRRRFQRLVQRSGLDRALALIRARLNDAVLEPRPLVPHRGRIVLLR